MQSFSSVWLHVGPTNLTQLLKTFNLNARAFPLQPATQATSYISLLGSIPLQAMVIYCCRTTARDICLLLLRRLYSRLSGYVVIRENANPARKTSWTSEAYLCGRRGIIIVQHHVICNQQRPFFMIGLKVFLQTNERPVAPLSSDTILSPNRRNLGRTINGFLAGIGGS